MSKGIGITPLSRTLLLALGLGLMVTMVSAGSARAGHTLCSARIEEAVRDATGENRSEEPATSLYLFCSAGGSTQNGM